MLNKLKRKKLFIVLCYLLVFIYTVIIQKYSLGIFVIVYFGLTLFFCILFYATMLGLLGNYYYATANYRKGEKYLLKAIKHNTAQPTVYLNYAIVLLRGGKAEEALSYLEKARAMNRKITTDQNIGITIGSCYLMLNQIEKAIDTLEDLKRSYGHLNCTGVNVLSYAYFRLGQYEQAQNAIEELGDTSPNAQYWNNAGLIYYKAGNAAQAEECFMKALEGDSRLIESHYYMGELMLEKGDAHRARLYFEQAACCKPAALGGIRPENAKEKLEELNNK